MQAILDFLIFWLEIPFEMLGDWPLGTLIGVFLLACYAIVILLIIWGIFRAIDSWFQPIENGMGTVKDKRFTPAYMQTIMIYNAATKTSFPHFIHHSDYWTVTVEVNGSQDSIAVNESYFNEISKGDQVFVDFVTGRISGQFYLRAIYS